MLSRKFLRLSGSFVLLASLACTMVRVTPQPTAPVEQLNFEIQTATPTISFFSDAPDGSLEPDVSATPPITGTTGLTPSLTLTATTEITSSGTVETTPAETPTDEP